MKSSCLIECRVHREELKLRLERILNGEPGRRTRRMVLVPGMLAAALFVLLMAQSSGRAESVPSSEAPPEMAAVAEGELTRPVAVEKVQPKYPALAREAGVQAAVILRSVVDEDGRVRQIRPVEEGAVDLHRAEGGELPAREREEIRRALVEAAVEAVSQWRFQPALRQGIPVATEVVLTIHFRLDDADGKAPVPAEGSGAEPALQERVDPTYPEAAKKAGASGIQQLWVLILPDGRVGQIKPLNQLPHGLTEAAVEAASQWRFEPQPEGESAGREREITVRFELE